MIRYVKNYKPRIYCQVVKWEFPEIGFVKCNTDGAYRGNLGIGAYGFCLRNKEGDILYAQGGNIGYTTNVITKMKQSGTVGSTTLEK